MSQKEYPYEEGDTIVLGPEIFASKDRSVISWQGENYYLLREAVEKDQEKYFPNYP